MIESWCKSMYLHCSPHILGTPLRGIAQDSKAWRGGGFRAGQSILAMENRTCGKSLYNHVFIGFPKLMLI